MRKFFCPSIILAIKFYFTIVNHTRCKFSLNVFRRNFRQNLKTEELMRRLWSTWRHLVFKTSIALVASLASQRHLRTSTKANMRVNRNFEFTDSDSEIWARGHDSKLPTRSTADSWKEPSKSKTSSLFSTSRALSHFKLPFLTYQESTCDNLSCLIFCI